MISFSGKKLGAERCQSIVTDDMTLSRRRKLAALKGRILGRFRGVERPYRPTGPLSTALLPKTSQKAIKTIAVYESVTW